MGTAQPNWLKPECDIRLFRFVLPRFPTKPVQTADVSNQPAFIARFCKVEPQCIAALRLPYQLIRNHLILAGVPVKSENFSLFDVLNIPNTMRGHA
jgi:hypothetical protein